MRRVIEHEPYAGTAYQPGGLMIWGFSHHRKPAETDTPGFTKRVIEDLALTEDHWFFSRLRTVCGGSDAAGFWKDVAFANTLPDAVVGDIYSDGDAEAVALVSNRVLRVLKELQPRRAILFSRKGWRIWPPFNGRYDGPSRRLNHAPQVEWGSYDTGAAWETLAYNLPHPQFQRIDDLTAAVSAILDHDPDAI